jgi:hypothetical protein
MSSIIFLFGVGLLPEKIDFKIMKACMKTDFFDVVRNVDGDGG